MSAENACERINAKTRLQKCRPSQCKGVSLRLIQQVINGWQQPGSQAVGKKPIVANHPEPFVRNVLDQSFDKGFRLTGHALMLLIAVIKIIKDNLLSIVVFQPTHREGWSFQITPQILHVFLRVIAGFGKVDNPVLLVMLIQPVVKLRGCRVCPANAFWECKFPRIIRLPQQVNNPVAP